MGKADVKSVLKQVTVEAYADKSGKAVTDPRTGKTIRSRLDYVEVLHDGSIRFVEVKSGKAKPTYNQSVIYPALYKDGGRVIKPAGGRLDILPDEIPAGTAVIYERRAVEDGDADYITDSNKHEFEEASGKMKRRSQR